MEWVLWLGLAINDPDPIELAKVGSKKECDDAVFVFWMTSQEAAKKRGTEAAPDLYLECRPRKNPGVPG